MGKKGKIDKELIEYRQTILEQKSKSDDDFEKYITFISSGALIITLTFVDKISPLETSVQKWTLILGWVFFATTLLINLISHYLSSRYNEKTIQDLDEQIPFEDLICKIKQRNNVISTLNIISIISLGIGILGVLTFATINAYNYG
jgi:preprotein translocase subunit SecG